MKLRSVLLAVLLISSYLVVPATSVAATPAPTVVISQVMPNYLAASQEYISIYNNSDEDIDVTNWCLRYNGSLTKPGCISPPSEHTKMVLPPRAYTSFASHEFAAAIQGFSPQARAPFVAGLADSGGTITLLDSNNTVRDQFTWSKKLTAGTAYQRQIDANGVALNTQDNTKDFVQLPFQSPVVQSLYELGQIQDVCPNIAGTQPTLPDGYEIADGVCTEIWVESSSIDITEVLANSVSYDSGNEFVELYNPNNHSVQLAGYKLVMVGASPKQHVLANIQIAPGQYLTLSDTILGFTLPNTAFHLQLFAPSGDLVSEAIGTSGSPEANSWALIDNTWQFTSTVTPGEANQPSQQNEENLPATVQSLQDCGPGKYRNPTTNRCRTLTDEPSDLAPCAPDQYRNPETNRCRKLTALSASSLAPCRPDQERNPATNRCRAITTASSVQPCKDGQERNPDTNRCRNIVAPNAAQTPTDPNQTRAPNTLVMILVLLATVGYGVYEYRYDIANLYHKFRLRNEIKGS